MSYLTQENVFAVASTIYNEVQKKYGINVEGYYLNDIQTIMQKLWQKNKDKPLKSNQTPKQLMSALNKKTIELILPQIFNNIEAGFSNKTQNSLVETQSVQPNQQYQMPQTIGVRQNNQNNFNSQQQIDDKRINDNPEDAFERLRRQREQEGNYAQVVSDQKNIYSQQNYQNKAVTYENQLPITPKVRNEVEPDVDAERFVDGRPIFGNERQSRVRDVGPTNAPGFFRPQDPFGTADQTGPSLDSFFNNAANLRGVQNPNQANVIPGTNQNATKEYENLDVQDKFERLRDQYKQDGKLDKPQDASNAVEDVIGRRVKNSRQFVEHLDNRKDNKDNKDANWMANETTTMETFRINERENKVVEDNIRKAQDELILNNQLSQNAYINYALIPPEKLNYQTRKYYITVDSLQRDLAAYPLPTNFQVRFEQPGDELEVPTFVNSNGIIVYGKPILFQNVGGRGAKLENLYMNLVELKCLEAQIPLDTIYVGGLPIYSFNGPQIDENKLVPNAFGSFPYGPIWKENYGIGIDVLDEPYYFLVVEEIDGAYDGTSFAARRALAKLNYDKLYGITRKFVGLKTVAYEGKTFYPTSLAKLSQMTLRLVTRFNQLLNVGVDKVYIKSIERGEEVVGDRFCPLPPGTHLTKITIIPDDPEYGQLICGVGLNPADRVLFYSTFFCNPLSQFTKLSDEIYINFDKYPIIYFYMVYETNDKVKREKKVDVRPFLRIGDLIVLNGKYVLDIDQIDSQGINVKVSARMEFSPTTTITSKGFVSKRKQGYNDPDKYCFLAENGQRVGGTLDAPLTFQVLYPFENIPPYLRSPPYGYYRQYEAFYIYAKKQISYTFEVTQVEQNMEKLDSRVVSAPS